MKRMGLMAATVLSLTITMTGCGSGGETGEKQPVKTTGTPSPTGPVSYSTVTDLRDAAIAAGYECPSWKQEDVVGVAAESGSCSDADVFSTYATPGDLQAQLEKTRSFNEEFPAPEGEETIFLVGPNWIINSPEALDLVDALGGTIQRF